MEVSTVVLVVEDPPVDTLLLEEADRVGDGLRAGRRSRDLAVEHGLQMKVDDSWSADVATAASLHLAMAVPPGQLIASVDMRPYFDRRISREGPVCENYRFAPNALPGLGLVADLAGLGESLR